jgi:hypothetical protein
LFPLALFLGVGATPLRSGAQAEYVRFSRLELFTFDELVSLEKSDTPTPALEGEVEHLFTTAINSNEAYLNGAKPKRPTSPVPTSELWLNREITPRKNMETNNEKPKGISSHKACGFRLYPFWGYFRRLSVDNG